MPYVQIPRDITKVKNKVAFGLTMRQLVCVGLALLIGVPGFWYGRKIVGDDIAFYAVFTLACPLGLMAFYEKDGVPLEKFIVIMIKARYLRPRTRIYQTDNLWEQVDNRIKIDKEIKRYARDNQTNAKKQSTKTDNRKVSRSKGTAAGAKKKDHRTDEKSKKDRENTEINAAYDSVPPNV